MTHDEFVTVANALWAIGNIAWHLYLRFRASKTKKSQDKDTEVPAGHV